MSDTLQSEPTTTRTWGETLDSLAAQIDLQEAAVRAGSPAPGDLEIHPPDLPLTTAERHRAIALFERCEELLDLATARVVASRGRSRQSPYGTNR